METNGQNNMWIPHGTSMQDALASIWIPIGNPGYAGAQKAVRWDLFSEAFGSDCWRESHIVRGRIVSKLEALKEYEQSYRKHLYNHPILVNLLVEYCGNVYDYDVNNTIDEGFEQPDSKRNHYQDIILRQIISEMVEDPKCPNVTDTEPKATTLIDLTTGRSYRMSTARGFRGRFLMQVRGPRSPGFCLSPAVVPVHDPTLCTTNPKNSEWYHTEGCGHLSIESFWQSSKVIEVRYDKYIEQLENIDDILTRIP